jgi:hypothetical protein
MMGFLARFEIKALAAPISAQAIESPEAHRLHQKTNVCGGQLQKWTM